MADDKHAKVSSVKFLAINTNLIVSLIIKQSMKIFEKIEKILT